MMTATDRICENTRHNNHQPNVNPTAFVATIPRRRFTTKFIFQDIPSSGPRYSSTFLPVRDVPYSNPNPNRLIPNPNSKPNINPNTNPDAYSWTGTSVERISQPGEGTVTRELKPEETRG